MMCIKSWSCSLKCNCKTFIYVSEMWRNVRNVAKKNKKNQQQQRRETCCGFEMGSVTFLCLRVFRYPPLGAEPDVKLIVRHSPRFLTFRDRGCDSQRPVRWGFHVHVDISQLNRWLIQLPFCHSFVFKSCACADSCPLQAVGGMTGVCCSASPLQVHNCFKPKIYIFNPVDFILTWI